MSSSSRESDSPVIAIITPLSKSAIYSVNLEENESYVSLIDTNEALPSPNNSSSDESTDTESLPTASKSKTLSTKRKQTQTAIVLRQSQEKEKFTLGSSHDSDIVLKHPESAGEECCYINLVHLQLYPNPESDILSVYNQSTSTFAVHRLGVPSLDNLLLPGEGTGLDCGKWRLRLGEGLVFQIKVLRRPIRDLRHGWSLISSQVLAVPEQVRHVMHATDYTLVYKVTRKERVFVVKQFRYPDIRQAAKAWRREQSLLSSLHHPSVVKLLHFDASDLHLELEFVGPNLTKYIDNHRMSDLSKTVQYQIWKDISNAIEYVHAQDIVHLDIKPSNILLREDRAVLCDFELSRKQDVNTLATSAGTPSYIPPEYLLLKKRGLPGDIWAFGVTMLFVLGHIPLPNGKWIIANLFKKAEVQKEMINWLQLIKNIRETNLPPALRLMLADDPKKRSTAAQLVASLPGLDTELKPIKQ